MTSLEQEALVKFATLESRLFTRISDVIDQSEPVIAPRDWLGGASVLLRHAAIAVYTARGIDMTAEDRMEVVNWTARCMAALSDRIDRRAERERMRAGMVTQ